MPKYNIGDLIETNLLLEKDKNKKYYWIVKCTKCGLTRSVRQDNLCCKCRSCAAKDRKPYFKDDLIGKTFGKWTVLSKAEKTNYWHCKCQCGTERDVFRGNLTQGMSKSCGCEKSWGENQIAFLLKRYGIIFIQEYSFKDLITDKMGYPRFDFAIFHNNQLYCLIEYDGRQHFSFEDNWNGTEEDFKRLCYIDNLKNNYCKEHNLKLIRFNAESSLDIEILKIKAAIDELETNNQE